MSQPTRYVLLLPIAGAAVGVVLVFLSAGAHTQQGIPILPLDDSYIHLQYAWQASQGHFLQYNSGDAPTTGATSLLYMLLLAGLFKLGVSHDGMPAMTIGIGAIAFVATALLVTDIIRRVCQELQGDDKSIPPALSGLFGGLLFVGTGWMAWGFLTGMETGFYVSLIALAIWGIAARRPLASLIGASLAVMTRPEAVLLAGAFLVVSLLSKWREPELNDWAHPFWFAIPVGALAAAPFVNLVASGSVSASGLLAKSWLTLVPFQLPTLIGEIVRSTLDLVVYPLGGVTADGTWYAFPLAQPLAMVGGIILWRQGSAGPRRLVLVCALWIVLSIVAIATLQTYGWHRYRYVMSLYPALLPLACYGLIWLVRRAAAHVNRRLGIGLLTLLVLVWGFFSLRHFQALYRLDSETAVQQQIPLATWLRENTEADARIAVHDVGMLRYFGGRSTFDVVGLTTAGMSAVNRNGPGSTFEALEQTQPDYFAVYAEGAPPFWGVSQTEQLVGMELFRVKVEPFGVTSAHPTQIVTRPDWSRVDLADAPQQPDFMELLVDWEQVDQLDVADLESETAHTYEWQFVGTFEGFASIPQVTSYVADPSINLADGGRIISGSETFQLHTHPGEPLLLVGRFDQRANVVLQVTVDNQPAGEWRLPQNPGQWLESRFLLPGELITTDETTIRLEVVDPDPGKAYLPFHYWAYQDGKPPPLSRPDVTLNVHFADSIVLRGVSLSAERAVPGESLSVRLDWEIGDALAGPHPYKVFLHLTDPARADVAEGVLSQVDGAPRSGTYPFWVWAAGEQVDDTVTIDIPNEIPSGDYLLLLGIYDADTGARLPVTDGDDFGASRVALGTIFVDR